MKSNWISFLLLFLFLFIFSACEKDFLNTVPSTSIDETQAYSSPAKILAQVNNLYAQMQNPIYYGGRMLIFNEQRADEFGQNDGNAATGSAVWNQNVASTSEYINNLWTSAYAAINSANILIEKLSSSSVVSDSLKKLYIGEAKFVRALCYLNLVQTYAKPFNLDSSALGVPLRLKAISSKGNNDLARSSVGDVYLQIIEDLNDAEKSLPVGYTTAYLNTSRAHQSTAIALKTRVYLNMNRFQDVVTEAAKMVSSAAPFHYINGSVSHQLESNFANLFTGSYTGAESILSIVFANTTTETPPSQFALSFNYITQPILFLAKEGIGHDSLMKDLSDARSNMIGLSPAKHRILRKFAISTAPFRDYVPVIRYAEVLLNYAEAAAQIGQLSQAQDLLKAVRKRSKPGSDFEDAEINTKEALVKTILKERRIEFLGEGLRLQDIQRQVLPLAKKTGSIGTAPEVLPTANNYIWPIPSDELAANKLCLPN
ncbi:MAG TPA: RagB/SusD family nutrient uptake outer membrane protein [Saprospiraceae bacterium]|nr:RagB/SusD family nutrient uptake outer membrane protein [Saprospiraceae bacterium]